VPLETEDLTSWLYQRFIEKEDLLSHFYKTGTQPFPCTLSSYQRF
jgi:lysophosphatidylglycerol acyltransferase 1